MRQDDQQRRIGILGGTFDPIHYAHLAIAEEAAWALSLAMISMVPTARQPLKREPHSANPAQRMQMVRLACADNPLLVPSDIELRRTPPSYTIDTLRELHATLDPPAELWFILGGDAVADLPRWRDAEQLLSLTHLAVVTRPGSKVDLDALEGPLPGIGARTRLIDGPALDISGTELRRRIGRGQPVRYLLPDAVLAYIGEQQLYRAETPHA